MRPPRRTRGVRKSYVEEPIVLEDEDQPLRASVRRSRGDDDDDDDYDAQAAENPAQHEDEAEDIDVDANPEGNPSSDDDDKAQDREDDDGNGEGDDRVIAANSTGAAPPPKQRTRNLGSGMIQSRRGFHDIPHYPLETRIVTRVYAGPLRRYARYSALRDAMYGPEYQRIKIIWDLENRWADFPLLPPRRPPDDPQGITPSPWVPAAFELDQERSAFHWYDGYQIKSPVIQRCRVLDLARAERLLPRAQGGLITLIGPWDQQRAFQLGPQHSSLSLSASGLVTDTDSDTGETSGWMLDVGGIPLNVTWAPLPRAEAQVLAVAAVPFEDQESVMSPDVSAAETADTDTATTTGCIQLWEFRGRISAKQLASTSASPPRLLAAKFFDWGRPKRLQWCPVPLASTGVCGLLAVLCGDGRARVIEAKSVDAADSTHYGSS